MLGDGREGFGCIARRDHVMTDPRQDAFQGLAVQLFVIDDEHVVLAQWRLPSRS